MTSQLITLTTDFGTSDPYVAEIKGVLMSAGPAGLRLVDLSHAIPRHDIAACAQFLASAVPCFPAGTIHLVVVDPGVGSSRAPMAMRYGHQYLVLPDNGLVTDLPPADCDCVAIDTASLGPHRKSATFHGRDVFAPAAARLAQGAPLGSLGTPIQVPQRLPRESPTFTDRGLRGSIVHVDHFGNLRTNIERKAIEQLEAKFGPCLVHCGDFVGPILDHYAQVAQGSPLSLLDSQQRLEVAVREGDARVQLGCDRGDPVDVLPATPLG